ncbi:MAG: glycosyl hydrolase family 18 protein [Dysgonomonas sp.]|nr:glycosyl hydrolase family 18 protein [Dysgonomonas sp.]
MKNLTIFFFSLFIILYSCDNKRASDSSSEESKKIPIVLAYITAWNDIMPDTDYVTHLNYAFGEVNETFNGINISNEERLKKIVGLREKAPNLKIMLSIGGWGSGRFSEMAADSVNRKSFARDCKRVVNDFGLDGIDMDWEYPTSSAANISSSPDDTENFTLLMCDIRNEIGTDKLLTLASVYSAKFVDFRAIDPYIDFVNIMTYDMGRPPYHNAPLHKSEYVRRLSADESVDAHVVAGVPLNKLTLGMPFYGHGIDSISDFIDYKDMPKLEGYTQKWDSLAMVPYLVDKDGKFVCSYDDERSLKIKSEYLLEKGLLGAMYWEYSCDDESGTLRKIVYNTVMKK